MLPQIPLLNQNYKPLLTFTIKKEEPKEPTLDEKIASNYYTCTNLQWIRADNATCLDKPIAIVETPVAGPQNVSQTAPTVFTSSASQGAVSRQAIAGNAYTAGQCTEYAKRMRPDMPNNLGNADTWGINAAAQGFTVSDSPQVGAVAVARFYMHVAIVTAIHGNSVEVSEQNYQGPFIISTRTAPISEFTYIL